MIHKFTEIFESILNDNIRDFIVEGFSLYEEDGDESGLASNLKSTVNYLIEICEVIEAEDTTRDIVLAAGLLHKVGDSVMDARIKLAPLMPKIGREIFNSILFLIERQDGFSSPYPEYQPQVNSPVHIWVLPIAKQLANNGG